MAKRPTSSRPTDHSNGQAERHKFDQSAADTADELLDKYFFDNELFDGEEYSGYLKRYDPEHGIITTIPMREWPEGAAMEETDYDVQHRPATLRDVFRLEEEDTAVEDVYKSNFSHQDDDSMDDRESHR